MINEYQAKKFCRDDITIIENYDKAIADTHRQKLREAWNRRRRDFKNEKYMEV